LLLLFLALSLFDVWSALPPALHKLALATLVAGSVYSLMRNVQRAGAAPVRTALRRLEDQSGLAHRPLDLLNERLAAGAGDPLAEALWRAHEAQGRARLSKIGLLLPQLSLATRDPMALRFLAVLLLAVGVAAAKPDLAQRLDKAFALGGPQTAQSGPRIDAWIDPPAYTKLPPVFLSQGAATSDGTIHKAGPVPAGSTLSIRIQGTRVRPRLSLAAPAQNTRSLLRNTGAEAYTGSVVLGETSTIAVKSALSTLVRYQIAVAADAPPAIAFLEPVQVTPQKALRISYRVADDYGVTAVSLRMSRADQKSDVEPLDLPAPGGAGESKLHANLDLTAHPWAGLPVQLQLAARDGAGQEGVSAFATLILPERIFTNPLARALVAARRDMMRDPRQTGAAADVIDQVSNALAAEDHDKALLLALRSAFWSLADAAEHELDARLHAAALMWQVAIALEDGATAEAKTQLDQARQALGDALKNGATEAEIAQRMAALRAALARYLAALQAKLGQPMQGPVNPALRAITPQDFARLLDTLENLARTGAKGEAEKMLSALDDILQNLNTGKGSAGDPGQAAQDEAMKALSALIGQQRALMDQTFRANQEEPPKDGAAKKNEALRGLAEQQEALRRQLGQAMTALGEHAGAIPKSLGRSERAMSAAREALAGGQSGLALGKQQEALDALRDGARDLADSLARGNGGRPGGMGMGAMPSADPFGRPNAGAPDQGDSVKVPNAGEAQRARAILEEIRRRAAERGRPPEELDYLDRLLRRF
jgi:uncharacterized protein (TIGR02302 family)